MGDFRAIEHQARQDASRFPSVTGVSGTMGTADTTGTAEVVRIGANPTTGALYVQDLAGASGTTNVLVVGGTLNAGTVTVGSIGNVGVIHNAGTLAVGTNNFGDVDIATGTVTLLSTVTTVSNLTNGSINILTGTIQNSGTTTGVGVVSNLTNGSVNVLTGTITSVSEVVKGTTTLVSTVTTVSNLTNGSINLLTGTLTSLSNLAAGTVQINPDPVPTMLPFGTLGTAGGSFFATLSAASGAGTKHFVSHIDIIMESGTADVRVLAGSLIQGTGVLSAGKFPPGGGIHNDFDPAFETGTNSELIYHFVGAGTAFIKAYYWKGT